MKRYLLMFAALAAIICNGAPQAFAVGFGFYGMGGVGSADWNDDQIPKFTTDTQHRALGISLDTGLSNRHFFNYHLNIGRETFTSKNFVARDGIDSVKGDLELDGLVISNTFGFGGQLSDSVRMWMGPEVRWHFVKGTPAKSPNFNLDGAGFGFGASLGLNFNFPSGLTLMVKAGYIMSKYALDGEGNVTSTGMYSYNTYDADDKFTYLQFEFLFRSPGDR